MRLISSKLLLFIFLISTYGLYAQNKFLIISEFDKNNLPETPDYKLDKSWAALPNKLDEADQIPQSKRNLMDNQSFAKADVFFIYPTIYTQMPKNQYTWNASIDDVELNAKIDKSTMKNQASVFNGSCKIYSPKYRQAHYSVFLTKDSVSAKSAMDLAYSDVKTAFEYYLKNYNHDRPIIISAHSQGTLHAIRLLKEFFDNKPLHSKLITAYLVGMPVNDSMFENIKICSKPGQTGGYESWNTFAVDYFPDYYKNGLYKAQVINPVNWTSVPIFSDYSQHKGTVGLRFKVRPKKISAKPENGLLWIKKPKIVGKAFIKTKIWHFADYNLFWMDIRDNVALQVNNFIEQHDIK